MTETVKTLRKLEDRIKPLAKAKNTVRVGMELNKEEIDALYKALRNTIVYYDYRNALTNDTKTTHTELPKP